MPLDLDLSLPEGPILRKYLDLMLNDDFMEIAMMGGFACVAGHTRIYDAELDRHVPVADLYKEERAPVVMAWNGRTFEPRKATVPFIKGKADLYRVKLSSGKEITATLAHRFLTPDGWKMLSTLREAHLSGRQPELVGSHGLLPTSWGIAPKGSRQDALRSMRTLPSFHHDYGQPRRLYDARLHAVQGSGQGASRPPGGALRHSRDVSRGGGLGFSGSDTPAPLSSRLRSSLGSFLPPALRALQQMVSGGSASSYSGTWHHKAETALRQSLGRYSLAPQAQLSPAGMGLASPPASLPTYPSTSSASVTPCGDTTHDSIASIKKVGYDFFYDLHVPELENYLAEGIVNHNTAKSNALVDRLALAALYYPGANILFARNTLSDLKQSSLMRLKQRWGATFESENNVEAVYRFEKFPHPVTGELMQSQIICIGLDRNNLEDVMKSREFFRAGLEEGNGMPESAHDFVLARCRQEVFHSELKNRDWLLKRYRKWGITWEDALSLLDWGLEDLSKPMRGLIGVATVFNPEPNDPIWKRYVGVQYPDFAPTPDWVNKHVGIRRKQIDHKTRLARGYTFQLGDMVRDAYGNINHVFSEDKASGKVKLVKPIKLDESSSLDTVPAASLELIVERYSIYAWRWENESGNKDNTKASFLMEDKGVAEKYFEGKFQAKAGRVFPMFDRDIHVLPTPYDLLDRVRRLRGLAGIDQGGDHATAAVFYALSKFGTLLAFSEYTAKGESASSTAYNLIQQVPPGMKMNWYCDPAMRAVQYATMDKSSPMDRYLEAGIPVQTAPESGDKAIDTLMKLLEVREQFVGTAPASGLYIFDCCEDLIHMFETIEWKDVLTRRYKTIVDILDAAKFGACARRVGADQAQVVQQDTLTPEFSRTHGLETYGNEGAYEVVGSPTPTGSMFRGQFGEASIDFKNFRRSYGE